MDIMTLYIVCTKRNENCTYCLITRAISKINILTLQDTQIGLLLISRLNSMVLGTATSCFLRACKGIDERKVTSQYVKRNSRSF